MHRNILPALVEQDKMEADELLNNYTATNMTSEDEVETVTLPVFQSFQDKYICSLMKGHSYENLWLEPLFAIDSRVPHMRVIMSMIVDFAETADSHVSVLLRRNANSAIVREKAGLEIVAASDADFASVVGPMWSQFVFHCKEKLRQRQNENEPLSITVVDSVNHTTRGIVARESQLPGVLVVVYYQECQEAQNVSVCGHVNEAPSAHECTHNSLQEIPFEHLNSIFRAHIGDVERQLSNAFPPRGSVTEIPDPILSPTKTPMPPAPRKGRQSRRQKCGDGLITNAYGGKLKGSEDRPHQQSPLMVDDTSPLCNLILPTPEKSTQQRSSNPPSNFTVVLDVEMSTPRPLSK